LDAAQKSMENGRAIRLATKSPMHDSKPYFVHETAVVDTPSSIGDGTKIWHFSHILRGSSIGRNCTIGQNVVIGPDVVIGDSCKIQNNVSVYAGVELEDGVFCGPSMVFTNVINPRAEVERKTEYKRTLVKRGATIGANATVVCGHTIGRYAMIGAGAVVTKDVPDHTLVLGNPAVPVGHVCLCGVRLQAGAWKKVSCPSCGTAFEKVGRVVRPSRKKTSRKKSRKRK
jgi:UDP-2-acetamido-3-amino-2,3-dideoxy-glucuronate N-acetyltransferase